MEADEGEVEALEQLHMAGSPPPRRVGEGEEGACHVMTSSSGFSRLCHSHPLNPQIQTPF